MALAEIGARLRLRGADAFRRDAERSADGVDRLGREADQTDRKVANLGEAARRAGRGLGGLGKAAAGMGALAGAAAVGGIAVLGSSLLDTATRLEALSGKSAVVFGDQLGMVQKWAAASAEAMGLTETQAVGLAAGLSDLLVPIGFNRKAAAEMSTDIVGLSGALAQWSGGQYDAAGVAEILQGAMLGETDALQALGIAIGAADVEAALLAKGQDKLTGNALKQAEAQAIVELIYAKSTDAQESYRLGANKLGTAQAKLRAKIETLRERLATKLTPFFVEGMEFLESKLPTVEGYVDRFADALGEALKPGSEFRAEMATLGPALLDIAEFGKDVTVELGELASWMADNKEGVKSFAVVMGGLYAATKGLALLNFARIALGLQAITAAAVVGNPVVAGFAAALATIYGMSKLISAMDNSENARRNTIAGSPTVTTTPTNYGQRPVTLNGETSRSLPRRPGGGVVTVVPQAGTADAARRRANMVAAPVVQSGGGTTATTVPTIVMQPSEVVVKLNEREVGKAQVRYIQQETARR